MKNKYYSTEDITNGIVCLKHDPKRGDYTLLCKVMKAAFPADEEPQPRSMDRYYFQHPKKNGLWSFSLEAPTCMVIKTPDQIRIES